jgi:hypothetical protein
VVGINVVGTVLFGGEAMFSKFSVGLAIVAGFVLIVAEEEARGQSARPTNYFNQFLRDRPTVSPYLNLISSQQDQQRGAAPRPVYQTLVRPQLEQRRANQQSQRNIVQMQQQLSDLRQSFQQSQANTFGATGHPTRFMIYAQYYPGFQRIGRR